MTDRTLFEIQIHLGEIPPSNGALIVEAHGDAPRTETPVNVYTSKDGKLTVFRPR